MHRQSKLATLLLLAAVIQAADFYVSATAAGGGTGSLVSPWTLAETCANPQPAAVTSAVSSGTVTIWMRGGTYHGQLTCHLTGTDATHYVWLRGYPGEWVRWDGYVAGSTGVVVSMVGAWSGIWGVEFTNSSTVRHVSVSGSNHYPDGQSGGPDLAAEGTAIVNSWVHGMANNGFTAFDTAPSALLYGTVVQDTGLDAPDRQHGHCIYNHNNSTAKPQQFTANIISNCAREEIHQYTTSANTKGFLWADNGIFSTDNTTRFLFAGAAPIEGLSVLRNVFWSENPAYLEFFYNYQAHVDLTIQNNLFGNGAEIRPWYYRTVTISGNTIYNGTISFRTLPDNGVADYSMDADTLYSNSVNNIKVCNYDGTDCGAGWLNFATIGETYTGWESMGTKYATAALTTPIVRTVTNAYEAVRGNVYVFNPTLATTVSADVSGIVAVGDPYQVEDSQCMVSPLDSVCTPALTGTYAGGSITLPLTQTQWRAPYGDLATASCWNTDCNTCDPVPSGCETHDVYSAAKSTSKFRAFIVRRQQTYRTATQASFAPIANSATALVEWGYKDAAGTITYNGPQQTVTCAVGAACAAAIPQAIGDAWFRITWKDAGGNVLQTASGLKARAE